MLLAKLGKRTAFFVLAFACCTIGAPGESAQAANEGLISFVPDRMPLAPPVEPAPMHVGRWRQVYAEFEGRPQDAPANYKNHWVITQETITIWSGFGELRNGGSWRYRLNNETTPAELDLTVVGGQQQRLPSILKLEGDRLTVCLQNFAERGRPKDFTSRPGSGIGKFVYERMKASE